MTQPTPPTGGHDFADVMNTIREAPRWVVFAVVAGGVLLAWFLLSGREKPEDLTGPTWHSRAVELLVERGYYRPNAERAVSAYLSGGYMTAEDISLITIVLRALGRPPTGERSGASSSSTEYPGDPMGTSNETLSYDLPSGVSSGEYWRVPVAPAGWSSTFNGISLQFYGSTSQAALLQQENPDLQSTTYGKLPVGSIVKVPRG